MKLAFIAGMLVGSALTYLAAHLAIHDAIAEITHDGAVVSNMMDGGPAEACLLSPDGSITHWDNDAGLWLPGRGPACPAI